MNLSKDCLESPTISAIFRQKQGSNSVITELCICSSSNNADWMIGATWEFSMKYQQESAGLLRNQKCQMETSGRSALEWKPPLSGRGRYESCKHIHFFTFTPPLSPPAPSSHCLLEQEVRNPNAVHIFVTLRLSGHLLRRQISQADKTQMAPLSGRPARTRQWKTIQIRDKWKHPDYALNHQQPDWLADGGWTGCLIKWLELQTPKQGHQLFHHRWAGYRPNVVSAWDPHQETQTAWAWWKTNNSHMQKHKTSRDLNCPPSFIPSTTKKLRQEGNTISLGVKTNIHT